MESNGVACWMSSHNERSHFAARHREIEILPRFRIDARGYDSDNMVAHV